MLPKYLVFSEYENTWYFSIPKYLVFLTKNTQYYHVPVGATKFWANVGMSRGTEYLCRGRGECVVPAYQGEEGERGA